MTDTRSYTIAALPGDGIGNEVLPGAVDVLDELGRTAGISFTWERQDWGCDYYLRTGKMMPEDAFETLSVTEVDAESPAASVARAVSVWVPFVIEVVTHE